MEADQAEMVGTSAKSVSKAILAHTFASPFKHILTK